MQLKGNSILRLSKRSTIKHEVEDRNGKMKMRLKELNMLMNGDYTFAIWINPTKIPTNAESKKNTLSILCREMSPIGLNILRSGGACMIHPATGRPAIAKTAQSIPVGRWTHLAGVVRRKQGAVELFVNGKLAGRASFTPNAPVESVYIRSSHFLVGGISDQRSMEWGSGRDNDTRPAPPRYLNHAFVGKVDEIRLYFRGLDAKEVKQIYDIHAGLAN